MGHTGIDACPEVMFGGGMRVERVGDHYPMLNGVGLFTYLKDIFSHNAGASRLIEKYALEVVHFRMWSLCRLYSFTVYLMT